MARIRSSPSRFSRRPVCTRVRVLAGEGDGVRQAQEVRGVEQEHVQRMRGDPLAAVEQAPQLVDRGLDGDAERRLQRLTGGELVGCRADATDARGEVR